MIAMPPTTFARHPETGQLGLFVPEETLIALSIADGLVIEPRKNWATLSEIRGGRITRLRCADGRERTPGYVMGERWTAHLSANEFDPTRDYMIVTLPTGGFGVFYL